MVRVVVNDIIEVVVVVVVVVIMVLMMLVVEVLLVVDKFTETHSGSSSVCGGNSGT